MPAALPTRLLCYTLLTGGTGEGVLAIGCGVVWVGEPPPHHQLAWPLMGHPTPPRCRGNLGARTPTALLTNDGETCNRTSRQANSERGPADHGGLLAGRLAAMVRHVTRLSLGWNQGLDAAWTVTGDLLWPGCTLAAGRETADA